MKTEARHDPDAMIPMKAPSPNFDDRGGQSVDILLLHYTGMRTGEAAMARLRDPAARVSAHYVVEEDGRVFALVDEDMRAWHAGVSYWAGARDVNGRSIGVEIVNPGHEFGYRAFPEIQIRSVIALCTDIVRRRRIPARRVLGHADVAPARKCDPGEKFPWARLAACGVGLAPEAGLGATLSGPGDRGAAVAAMQMRLAQIGYDAPQSGVFCAATRNALSAFQRHYRPSRVHGRLDGGTANALSRIAAAARRR